MHSITIDTNLVQNEIENLKQINIEMNALFEKVNKKMSTVSDIWDGRAAIQTMNEYKVLSNKYSSIIEKNNNYIKFLENVVKESHENMEESIDTNIDSKIAVN